MRNILSKLLFLNAFISIHASNAHSKEIVFSNRYDHSQACQTSNSCALKSANITATRQQFIIDGTPSLVTKMYAQYETASLSSLEQFVFVQFLRGCLFESKLVNGKIVKTIAWTLKDNLGEKVPFHFPEWSVDSVDADPAYYSTEVNGTHQRHWLYAWNTEPGSFNKKTLVRYGNQKPTSPQLYIEDMPSTAYYIKKPGSAFDGMALNKSISFKTCLFKAIDVPLQSNGRDFNDSRALHCFEWNDISVFNHHKEVFEHPKSIDSFCTQAN